MCRYVCISIYTCWHCIIVLALFYFPSFAHTELEELMLVYQNIFDLLLIKTSFIVSPEFSAALDQWRNPCEASTQQWARSPRGPNWMVN